MSPALIGHLWRFVELGQCTRLDRS